MVVTLATMKKTLNEKKMMTQKNDCHLVHMILLPLECFQKQSNVAPPLLLIFWCITEFQKKMQCRQLWLPLVSTLERHCQIHAFLVPAYLTLGFLPFPTAVLWCRWTKYRKQWSKSLLVGKGWLCLNHQMSSKMLLESNVYFPYQNPTHPGLHHVGLSGCTVKTFDVNSS
jgi:hypothetical protein